MACVLLLVAGCENDAAFEAAERANTPASWEEYLRQHPDGSNAREARERLAARIDDREWFRADEAHTQAAYESYLRAYPQGIHSHEGLLAIANLNLVVPPPKKEAVAEVQLVAPPEPVLRKPSAGAIERATKPGSATSAQPKPSPAGAPAKVAVDDAAKVARSPAGIAPAKASAAAVAAAIKASPPAPVPQPATKPAVVASETKPKVAAVVAAPAPQPAVKIAAVASAPAKAPAPAPAAAPVSPSKPVRPTPAEGSAPAKVATEPAALRAEDARGYRVQLGAFFSEGSATAERVWTQLQSRYTVLRERHPIIAAARSADGRSIYRLQVGGLERDAAETLCASLAAEHDPCIVIAPLKGRAP